MSRKSTRVWHARLFVVALLLAFTSSATAHSSLPIIQDDEGVKLFNAGKQLLAQGTVDSIRAAVEKFKQAAQRFHVVGDGWAEGASLTMLAAAETALSDNASALAHLQQALPLIRASGDRSGEANALANIANAYDNLAEKQKAIEFDNQALTILRELKDRAGEATVLTNIGKVLMETGQPAKAIEYFNQALPIRREARDQNGEAATLSNLGVAYNVLGHKAKALDYFQQALPLLRAAGDRRLEAITLSNIGEVFDSQGEKEKALKYFEQTLEIQRPAGDRFGEATTMNNIGLVYASMGEFQKAFDSYSQALTLARTVGHRYTEGIALSNIGALYYSVGEYQTSLDYYRQSLVIKRAITDQSGQAIILNNIGGVLHKTGDLSTALNHYNQALSLFRATDDLTGQANTLNNAGELYWELSDNQKAIDSLNQALSLRRAVGDRPGEAITLNNIALVYDRLGEKTRALEFHEQSLKLSQAVADHIGEALTLFNIALIERDRGLLNEALTRVKAAIVIVESLRSRITSQDLRASYFATVRQYYDLYIEIMMRMHKQQPNGGYDALALQASEQGRARSLLELLSEARADIHQGVDERLLERERTLQRRLNAKAQERIKAGEDLAKSLTEEIAGLTTELQQVETEIRTTSPRYANLTQPQPLTTKEIQTQVLDGDTVLLEYSLGVDKSYLWLVTSRSVASYELPPREEIESAARELYELLKSPDKWGGDSLNALRANRQLEREPAAKPSPTSALLAYAAPDVAMRLSRMLLAPVSAQIQGKRLLIVADGALQYIPFAALPIVPAESGNAASRPLLSEHEIVMLPSASTISVLRTEAKNRKVADKSVALAADPVFESNDERVRPAALTGTSANQVEARRNQNAGFERATRDTQGSGSGLRIARLPATRDEAKAIMRLAPPQTSKQALDFDANRDFATNADLSHYRFVHFATHGFVDSVHPELSGIVLSLVDKNGNSQDGFLRAHEVFNLDLSADLVVLSACQTGLGKEVRGEGLIGLTRGFMYAGSPRVVVSLWSVNDQATAELMARFYRAMLVDKLPPSAALRAAQLSLMKEKQWQAPFFWAAFTLQGEWR